jgi:hypothetical protein
MGFATLAHRLISHLNALTTNREGISSLAPIAGQFNPADHFPVNATKGPEFRHRREILGVCGWTIMGSTALIS